MRPMADPTEVNTQVTDALKANAPEIEPGKAYQAVAQATAIEIQEASDQLRNISETEATAIGVAIAEALHDHPFVPSPATNDDR